MVTLGAKGVAKIRIGTADAMVYIEYDPVDDQLSFERRRSAELRALCTQLDETGSSAFRASLAPAPATTAAKRDKEPDEIRTLAVTYDEHGERYKMWRDVSRAFTQNDFKDWPVEGPRTMGWLAKHFARLALTPTTRLEKHLRDNRYADSDRSVHELRVIAEAFEHAGSYDQLNLSSLASFELLARR